MGGSEKKDGLSLYPLQWMLLESKSKRLGLEFSRAFNSRAPIDDPLRVVLPKNEADGKGEERWSCTTENGLQVHMQDLRRVDELTEYKGRYAIEVDQRKGILWPKKAREPFTPDGVLKGYCSFGKNAYS